MSCERLPQGDWNSSRDFGQERFNGHKMAFRQILSLEATCFLRFLCQPQSSFFQEGIGKVRNTGEWLQSGRKKRKQLYMYKVGIIIHMFLFAVKSLNDSTFRRLFFEEAMIDKTMNNSMR